jgi:hypothetical protein
MIKNNNDNPIIMIVGYVSPVTGGLAVVLGRATRSVGNGISVGIIVAVGIKLGVIFEAEAEAS